MFNVKFQFWGAQTLLNMWLSEEARHNSLVAIQFERNNEEIK